MRRIEIEVSDSDYQKAKDLLENLKYVKAIRDKCIVDDITLLSQASLAEDWDSEEDSVWDQYYNETKPTRDSTSQL